MLATMNAGTSQVKCRLNDLGSPQSSACDGLGVGEDGDIADVADADADTLLKGVGAVAIVPDVDAMEGPPPPPAP